MLLGQTKSLDAYVVVHAKPEASIGVLTAPAKAGEEVTFKDNSSPLEDITSWEWQFDDGTTEQWTAAQRQAADGQIKHVFKKAGKHTVSLTVTGALGESYYNKSINVTGGGGFQLRSVDDRGGCGCRCGGGRGCVPGSGQERKVDSRY